MRVADIAPERTVFAALAEHYRLAEAAADVPCPVKPGSLVEVSLPLTLRSAALRAISRHGLYPFVSSEGYSGHEYLSMSLTHNGNPSVNPHRATLGSSLLSRAEHYYASPETIAKFGSLRGSYYDSYSFCQPTPAAVEELSPLTSRLKRTMVRSRMSVVKAGRQEPTCFNWGWHKDESVFENLRVNIPVITTLDFRIQVTQADEFPKEGDPRIKTHVQREGFAYSWDTNLPHRACATAPGPVDRINIVLGTSPWFDFDAARNAWAPNEFFGRKHPLQMLLDGDVL